MRSISSFIIVMAMFVTAREGRGMEFFKPLDPPRNFAVMVHRGWSAAPANTRQAIAAASQDMFEWYEADIRRTSDGVHVLCHPDSLQLPDGSSRAVSAMTVAEFRDLAASATGAGRKRTAQPTTLAEAFEAAKGKINLCLDCKDADAAQLVREILDAKMEGQTLVSCHGDFLPRFREAAVGKVAILAEWKRGDDPQAWMKSTGAAVVEIDANELDADSAASFHKAGLLIEARVLGTANETPAVWTRALAAGADIFQTDKPEHIVAEFVWKRLNPRPVLVSCHRGANRYAPENTMPAFRTAAEMGIDYVEFDVRPSKDGTYFLLHDGKLDRTTNGKASITEMPDTKLEGLDAGGWFSAAFTGESLPKLDAFLSEIGPRAHLYFDAKDIKPEDIASALKRYGLAGRTVVYQSADFLARLKEIDPSIGRLPPISSPDEVEQLAKAVAPFAFDASWKIVNKEFVDRCHAAGVKVFSDGLGPFSSVQNYRAAIAAGIDLIQTDEPMKVFRAAELESFAGKP